MPTGTFENVATPLPLVVALMVESAIGPPASVTVAPETVAVGHVTVTLTVAVGSDIETLELGDAMDWLVSVVVPLDPLTAVIV